MSDRKVRASLALAALFAASAPDVLSFGKVKEGIRSAIAKDPMETALATVLVASYLFFEAEKEHNPKVNSLGDAFVFISTCLSVGYSDIFARTETGKAIATAVMTFGPAMAERIFNPPEVATSAVAQGGFGPELLVAQREVVSKLEAILDTLKARG